jgi:hypothetical protein
MGRVILSILIVGHGHTPGVPDVSTLASANAEH